LETFKEKSHEPYVTTRRVGGETKKLD